MIRMKHFDMELTRRQAEDYQKVSKKQKGEIITQYCELTGVDRNLASKRFRKVFRDIYPRVFKDVSPKNQLGRNPTYSEPHKKLVHRIWKLSGRICGERLYPVVGEYLDQLEKMEN